MNYIKMWYVRNLHIPLNNKDKDLEENSVCYFFEHTTKDCKNYQVI